MISLRRILPAVFCFAVSTGINLALPSASAQQTVAQKIAADKGKLDLNTATPDEFKALGLGDNYVRRIIEGRPYTAKNQLVTHGVIPDTAYEPIKDRVIAHRPKKE